MSKRRFDRRELGAIYVGGVIGALARVGLSEALPHGVDAWPWATFIVNMVAAALLGWFVTRLGERLPPSTYRRPFLATGLCGALSTFSTLQLELFKMIEGGYLGLAAPTPRPRTGAASPASTSPPSPPDARGSSDEFALSPARAGDPMSSHFWALCAPFCELD